MNFFPTVDPARKSASTYYDECLQLVELAEVLGYRHVQCAEHYGSPYGGCGPDPVVFLTAAAARTARTRLTAGLAVGASAHPVETAARLALLDHLSHGRLEAGFGCSLPAVPGDHTRVREVVDACVALWGGAPPRHEGDVRRSGPVAGFPLPLQQPHPPVYVTSVAGTEDCARAGARGHHLQLDPSMWRREHLTRMIAAYRAAHRGAGHEGPGRVRLTYTCYVGKARDVVLSGADEHRGAQVLIGTPDDVCAQIEAVRSWYGSDLCLSLQFNPGQVPYGRAVRAMELFAARVAPRFADAAVPDRAAA
ncbi:LLM class flavin-dependent oxidoreductase [Streptomyces sp. NPDC050264]|uniref:LLM class flavin-dependent oxidoreductase n=1 Tax=Streptomyces sp. NPDC050264 TaxID=3155038 RepID=UPI0034241509